LFADIIAVAPLGAEKDCLIRTEAASNISAAEPPMNETHPRGTLAIVAVLGLLFLAGWLAMFVFVFLRRGAPHI
jgi:uncharacterized protein involved in exopolysaccharide biosynthesis